MPDPPISWETRKDLRSAGAGISRRQRNLDIAETVEPGERARRYEAGRVVFLDDAGTRNRHAEIAPIEDARLPPDTVLHRDTPGRRGCAESGPPQERSSAVGRATRPRREPYDNFPSDEIIRMAPEAASNPRMMRLNAQSLTR